MAAPEVRPARIGLYGGGGAPFHHAALFARVGHEVEFVFPVDILAGALRAFDALVVPGGGYRAMLGQIEPLGAAGARAIADFVRAGGMYLGCCAGSYCAAVAPRSFSEACPPQAEMCLLPAEVWNQADTEWLGLQSPGVGILRARNAAPDHPVMAKMPRSFRITHYNGPFFHGAEALVEVEGATEHFTPSERFLADDEGPTLIDRAARAGVANVVAGRHGRGRVVLFGSHPEFGFTLAMDDEQIPARMLRNAIDWQLQESGAPELPHVALFTDQARPQGHELGDVEALATEVTRRTTQLRKRAGTPPWLARSYAMSVFGLPPEEVWRRSLDEIDRLAAETSRLAPAVDPNVLAFRPPPEWSLDGGYHGVVALLEQAARLLAGADAAWMLDLGEPSPNPYAFALTSPYHLVAASYLSAVGRLAGAALLCAAYERVLA